MKNAIASNYRRAAVKEERGEVAALQLRKLNDRSLKFQGG